MHSIKQVFFRFVADATGATALEYGIIGGIMGSVLLSAMAGLATHLNTTLSTISTVFLLVG